MLICVTVAEDKLITLPSLLCLSISPPKTLLSDLFLSCSDRLGTRIRVQDDKSTEQKRSTLVGTVKLPKENKCVTLSFYLFSIKITLSYLDVSLWLPEFGFAGLLCSGGSYAQK